MSASPAFIASPKNPAVAFANADSTTFKTLLTAGASGSRLDTLIGTSTDTVANIVQLCITRSAVDYLLGEIGIPANAGTNGTVKSVAVLNPTDIPGLSYTEGGGLFLESGSVLKARVKTSVAGAFSLQLVGIGGDY